jgi:hypothetical protein
MGTPLSDKIGEIINLAIHSYDGYIVWRGDILGEQWKIIVSYDAVHEKINIYTKRRDYFEPRE